MKEQYQLLLEIVISQSKNTSRWYEDVFICNEIEKLDYKELLIDFKSRRPTSEKYSEFYNHKLFNKDTERISWWDCDDKHSKKSNEQRILFLKQIISEL